MGARRRGGLLADREVGRLESLDEAVEVVVCRFERIDEIDFGGFRDVHFEAPEHAIHDQAAFISYSIGDQSGQDVQEGGETVSEEDQYDEDEGMKMAASRT